MNYPYSIGSCFLWSSLIKDEGQDGDIDKIQYSTTSWMNLLNVYIVLDYYETAGKSGKKEQTTIEDFLQINMKVFTKKQKEIINKLALECKMKIQISDNSII